VYNEPLARHKKASLESRALLAVPLATPRLLLATPSPAWAEGQVQRSALFRVRSNGSDCSSYKTLTRTEDLVPPTIYYARVAGELTKLMFQGRNMYPP